MAKTKTWKTKYGLRKVKEAAPTIDEALIAAAGLSDAPDDQIAIAASLLGLDADEVRAASKCLRPPIFTEKTSSPLVKRDRCNDAMRTVVVERRTPKRLIKPAR